MSALVPSKVFLTKGQGKQDPLHFTSGKSTELSVFQRLGPDRT